MNELLAAAARVEESRQALRLALRAQGSASRPGAVGASEPVASSARVWPESWAEGLSTARSASVWVADAATLALLPVAQVHPVKLVGGAFIFGAVLVWSRPWSWLIKPAWFAAVVPQLLARALRLPLRPGKDVKAPRQAR